MVQLSSLFVPYAGVHLIVHASYLSVFVCVSSTLVCSGKAGVYKRRMVNGKFTRTCFINPSNATSRG